MLYVDKPGKPGTPEVKEATKTSATLTWKPPTDNGGSDITNYVVEYRADGAFKWKRATENVVPSTTHVVKGLDENVKYEFRVAAENKAGVGPPSEGSLAVKLEDAMGKPISRLIILNYTVYNCRLAHYIYRNRKRPLFTWNFSLPTYPSERLHFIRYILFQKTHICTNEKLTQFSFIFSYHVSMPVTQEIISPDRIHKTKYTQIKSPA